MRRTAPALIVWSLLATGCGDNSNQCGDGTVEVDGVCMPGDPPPPPCGVGTLLDEPTGTCVVDPAACTDGTVLIGGVCRDPADDVTVDLLEAAEPNGFGVGGEPSFTPAGVLTLPAAGAASITIKGTISPQPGADYDTYVLTAAGPTLLDVTVDGSHGVSGALVALAEAPALAAWRRESVSLAGDTAHRQLYLPVAGRYHLAITDTRTLLVGSAVGAADATYLVMLTTLALPVASPLTATNGAISTTGTLDERTPALFALPLGPDGNDLALTTNSPALTGSLVVVIDGVVAGVTTEVRPGSLPALLSAPSVPSGAVVVAIVEAAASTTSVAAPYTFDVAIAAPPPPTVPPPGP